jgi:hypothetical protein
MTGENQTYGDIQGGVKLHIRLTFAQVDGMLQDLCKMQIRTA